MISHHNPGVHYKFVDSSGEDVSDKMGVLTEYIILQTRMTPTRIDHNPGDSPSISIRQIVIELTVEREPR